ncbi:MAG: NAD(P)H-dependent oxidoreductase [Endomicrobium sp.]|jgi:flavodoxin|nr:NAD(P)H-dependent oxidoreductase [Endomicrobium sp.]
MLKAVLIVLGIIIIIACGYGVYHSRLLKAKNNAEMEKYRKGQIVLDKNFGRVLVVYYSKSGNTKKVAEIIKEKTNGDIYEIEIDVNYSNGFVKTAIEARKQTKTKKYPELKNALPDFTAYDLIFIGSPVWSYTVTPPVLSFLQSADLSGKTVVPFAAFEGNAGNFFKDFKDNAGNAKVLDGFTVFSALKENQTALENKITDFLNGIDIL